MSTDFELADDGKWYEHAVIGEPKRWFLCLDHEDPPDLVIRIMRKYFPFPHMEAYMDVNALIRWFRLPVSIVTRHSNADCLFPDSRGHWDGKLMQSATYEVKLTGVIPSKLIISYKDVFKERPTTDGMYYDGAIRV